MSYELKPRTEAGEKFVEATERVITNLRNRALISDQNSSIDEDNFFDFVHCAGVLHHTTDLPAGIKELARVTKEGGILVITTYTN